MQSRASRRVNMNRERNIPELEKKLADVTDLLERLRNPDTFASKSTDVDLVIDCLETKQHVLATVIEVEKVAAGYFV